MVSSYCLVLFCFAFWCLGYSCLVCLVDLFFHETWKFNNTGNPLQYSSLENTMDRLWDGKASDTTEELTPSLSFSSPLFSYNYIQAYIYIYKYKTIFCGNPPKLIDIQQFLFIPFNGYLIFHVVNEPHLFSYFISTFLL